MKDKIKDILIRAGKTFIQGFLATLIVLLKESDLSDTTMIKSILIGALAGGISAAMNVVLKALPKNEENEYGEEIEEGEE